MSGFNVTATLDIQGLRPDCTSRGSDTAPINNSIGCGLVMDEWEALKPNDKRARLDNFFADLANNPSNTGIIVLDIAETERFDSGNQRLKFVVKHVKFRKFDLNRIWSLLDRVGNKRTKVYRIPPGADMVPCDSTCITIKGGDL